MTERPKPKQILWNGELCGMTTVRETKLDGCVLPGAQMPWMWNFLLPPGAKQPPRYGLSECFRIEDGIKPGYGGPTNFFIQARELRSWERMVPPASPGFWDRFRVRCSN